MMLKDVHLTDKGYQEINKIKTTMNNSRVKYDWKHLS